MDTHDFNNLIRGVQEMKAHMAGQAVEGIHVTTLNRGDDATAQAVTTTAASVSLIRQSAQLTQDQFARLIGVNLRTLQNWEQSRTQPTGPAKALLKIVSANPRAAVAALHA
jgi:putative transcriptional regulator